jgi:hypothetical protein
MRLKRPTSVLALLGAALTLVAATATGVSLAAPAAGSPIDSAANKTAKAGSFRMAYTIDFGVTGTAGANLPPGQTLKVTGTGAFDTKHSAGQFSINLGPLAAALGSAVTGLPATIDIVSLGTAVYVKFPTLAAQVTAGKEWLKFDATKLPASSTGGTDLGSLSRQVNPQQLLGNLRAAVSTRKVGSARVRGTATTRYRATINLTKIVNSLPASQRASTLKSLRASGLTKLPLETWIDRSGYLRRVVTSTKVKSGGSSVTLKLTLDLFDYGAKIKISAPPAAEVADGNELLTQLLAGLTSGGGTTTPPPPSPPSGS